MLIPHVVPVDVPLETTIGLPLGNPWGLGIPNLPMHLASLRNSSRWALRTLARGPTVAGAMTRVTGPAAEAWRPQIQTGILSVISWFTRPMR